jgi:hypothetical protein
MGGGLSALFMADLVCLSSASGWFTSLLPAFGWLAGWRIIGEGLCNYLFLADFKV